MVFSDGAARSSTNQASAGWAIFLMRGENVHLAAAGAVLLDEGSTGIIAETVALEMAVKAAAKMASGCADVVPHPFDAILDSCSPFYEIAT